MNFSKKIPAIQVVFLKFLLSALASAILAFVVARFITDGSAPAMVVSIVAVSWIGLARHSIEEAYKLGQSALRAVENP